MFVKGIRISQYSKDIDVTINVEAAQCGKILDFDNKLDLDSVSALVLNFICSFKADCVNYWVSMSFCDMDIIPFYRVEK